VLSSQTKMLAETRELNPNHLPHHFDGVHLDALGTGLIARPSLGVVAIGMKRADNLVARQHPIRQRCPLVRTASLTGKHGPFPTTEDGNILTSNSKLPP
jgi:hypothetical protein